MFTDIVKSTNLLAAIGDEAWQHLLRWHNQTLASLIERHDGTVVDRTGDGFFAAFERESDALEAAVDIQRALVEHRRSAGFAPSVRIGLHATTADTDGRNWTGIGVHAAARIGALAEGDQILASQATVQDVGSRYPISDPRQVSLKGISDPMNVVAVEWRSGFGESPA
jgi:class 3 adenylate cyclase